MCCSAEALDLRSAALLALASQAPARTLIGRRTETRRQDSYKGELISA
jgi:hypothetical protein